MLAFNEQTAQSIDNYIEALFVPADPVLEANVERATAAGLPAIQVTPNQGKFLYLLVKIAGARRVLEVGTLGGYSTTWMARALPEGGRLITLEYSPKHAEVATANLTAAGLAEVVEVRVGDAAVSLQAMIDAGEAPFDFIFLDADKSGYVKYLELVMQLSRSGTVILADNIIRNGVVMEDNPTEAYDIGAKQYNAVLAADDRLESLALPMFKDKIDGIAISRVK